MRRDAFIGIALLALPYFAFANVTAALAQAGSTGGTIGKQDKSISGGEEADRPRAVPHPKRAATTSRETESDAACRRIVGTWSWAYGLTEMAFSQNGTAKQSSGNTGSWSCAGTIVKTAYVNGVTERIAISTDGHSASVTTTAVGGFTFKATRLSGGTSE
jgi:hypothetical protein